MASYFIAVLTLAAVAIADDTFGAADTDISGTNMDQAEADQFLTMYGYYGAQHNNKALEARQDGELAGPLEARNSELDTHTGGERKAALEQFQSRYHLTESGQLDKETLQLMRRPRCGNADVTDGPQDKTTEVEQALAESGAKHRVKRYKISKFADGSLNKWHVDKLTWKLTTASRKLDPGRQRDILRRAVAVWQKVVPITFEEAKHDVKPDIEILFARGRHGTGNDPAFDGKDSDLNKLAHAFGPGRVPTTLAGDVHFDEDDNWTEDNMFGVAVHELGHSMGLGHSKDEGAIMFPFYRDTDELGQDDILGIRALYGGSNGRRPTRPATRRPDIRRRTLRPLPRTRAPRPTPTYRTRRPDPGYRTIRPDPRYRTRQPDPRYRTRRPDPRYQTPRPDPRYRTRRPDPRYRTRRPDYRYRTTPRPGGSRYSTEPSVSPGSSAKITDALCEAVQRRVRAVVEDPFTKWTRMYLVIVDGKVHRMTSAGAVIQTKLLEDLFPGAPSNPDVTFSVVSKNSLFFIRDNQIWKYKDHALVKDFPRPVEAGHFPERPKFAMNVQNSGGDEVLLFGKTLWWRYDVDNPRKAEPGRISEFHRDFPNDIEFTTRWTDGLVYAMARSKYVIVDTRGRRTVQTNPVDGRPGWLRVLCAHGNSVLPPSWFLILLVSLIALLTRS